jgi:hypothetical protein
VGVVYGPGQHLGQGRRLAYRPGSAVEALGEAAALDELQRQKRPAVGLAHLVDLDDVGVVQARHRPGLAGEALPLLRAGALVGADHLEGHDAVQAELPGLEDDAHAAAAQLPQHLVALDRRPPGGRARRQPPLLAIDQGLRPRVVPEGAEPVQGLLALRAPLNVGGDRGALGGAQPVILEEQQLLDRRMG